ncbi:NifB/NifX family molybdenum-iron cluster-binding protein [Thermococcus sp.]
MKVAVPSANGGGLDDVVAPVFGRAPAFTIVDTDENGNIKDVKVIQNPGAAAPGGAGPMAVQLLINEGVEAVAAPQFGPNALGAIQAAGIRTYTIPGGTPIKEAVESISKGTATSFQIPAMMPVPSTSPTSAYPTTPSTVPTAYYPPAYGFGYGWGRGWRRGRGFGRGWGRGGRGWGARLGYCPWTGMPSRRTLRWYYGWW